MIPGEPTPTPPLLIPDAFPAGATGDGPEPVTVATTSSAAATEAAAADKASAAAKLEDPEATPSPCAATRKSEEDADVAWASGAKGAGFKTSGSTASESSKQDGAPGPAGASKDAAT